MRLPNWIYTKLDQLVRAERQRRNAESNAQAEAQQWSLRAWADHARAAHESGQCISGCPFAHPERSVHAPADEAEALGSVRAERRWLPARYG